MAIKVYQDDAANLKLVDTIQSTARTLDSIVKGDNSAHASRHQNGGADEIDVTGLTGAGGSIYPDNIDLIIAMNATNPNYQIDIDAGCLMLWTATTYVGQAFISINVTVDITVAGANGLDTGSEAASTWYYIWVIGKTDGTVAGLLSISSTAPTMPSGYTLKRLIGAIRNDGSSNFIPGTWNNGYFWYNAPQQVYSGNGTAAWTDRNCSAMIPASITRVGLFKMMSNADGNGYMLRRNGDTYAYGTELGSGNEYAVQMCFTDSSGIVESYNPYATRAHVWGLIGYRNII